LAVDFSIILPTLNEEKIISSCLSKLQHLRTKCEIIIADGGSVDNTLLLAESLADKIVSSEKGRGVQMNNGARQAMGEVLLFLHVDTILPDNAFQEIKHAINHSRQWGRFNIRFSGSHFMFRVIAQMMNWRSSLTGIATGDQVIFVTRTAFFAAGQYPDIKLMEDIALCKALKSISPPVCLKTEVTSSSRRWEKNGIFRTIVLMWTLRLLYFFNADPELLAHLYNRGRLWKH
jgi:rSAM/selenodomain-associated transferase 2